MLLVRTYIAPSRVHGLGLFAAEPIARDRRIWAFNPVVDHVIDPDSVRSLPAHVQEFVRTHSFVDWQDQVVLSADHAIYMNHGGELANIDADDEGSYAARAIAEGEELLEDYRQFGRGYCNEFLFA
jgi:hypothetical protein